MSKYRVRIEQDECFGGNPRDDFDHSETIYFLESSRYHLGDEGVSRDRMLEITESEEFITAPVYAYVHGAAMLSLSPFECPWDSGQSGVIAFPREELRDYERSGWDEKRVREDLFPAAIQEWNDIANGNIWGYVIEEQTCEKCETWEEVDSCWGFTGDGALDAIIHELALRDGISEGDVKEAWERRFDG